MRLMRMRIPLNVTPAVTGVIKCVIPEYDVLAREGESVLWKCPNCIAEGAKGIREHTSRTEAKLDMIVKLFQDIVARMENIEKVCSQKSIDEKIEETVERKLRCMRKRRKRIKESKTLS